MGKLRLACSLLVALAGLGSIAVPAIPVSAAAAAPRHDVRVTVPMTCDNGASHSVTVSAHIPRTVQAGRAFVLSSVTTDVPLDGAVHLALSNTTPGMVSAGTPGPSTLQLVAGTRVGHRIDIQVTGASYVVQGTVELPGTLIPGVVVTCSPTAPVSLGKIIVARAGGRPTTPTTATDVDLGVGFRIFGSTLFSGVSTIVTFTVPTPLTAGQTFSLPDLQARMVPDLDGQVTADRRSCPPAPTNSRSRPTPR